MSDAVTIRVEGDAEVREALKRAKHKLYGSVTRAVAVTLVRMDAGVKRELSQSGTGVVYGQHQASAPGEPPATDTGRLRSGVGWEIDADKLGGELHVNAAYALPLEVGTSKMAARPFIAPITDVERVAFRETVLEMARRAVGGSGI